MALNRIWFGIALIIGSASLALSGWAYTQGGEVDLGAFLTYAIAGHTVTTGLIGFVTIREPRLRVALTVFAYLALGLSVYLVCVLLVRSLLVWESTRALLLTHIATVVAVGGASARKVAEVQRDEARDREARSLSSRMFRQWQSVRYQLEKLRQGRTGSRRRRRRPRQERLH